MAMGQAEKSRNEVPPKDRYACAENRLSTVPLSISEHAPHRVDGYEHPLREIPKAPEAEAASERQATHDGLAPAVVDHIQRNRLEPHLARHIQGPAKSVNGKIRPETLVLPVSVHGNHGRRIGAPWIPIALMIIRGVPWAHWQSDQFERSGDMDGELESFPWLDGV